MPTMTIDIAELAEIVGENARLKKQVDDLQEANTRLLEERRVVDRLGMVRQFHRAGEVPVLDAPQVPDEARIRLRLRLVTEEFFEFLRASLSRVGSWGANFEQVHESLCAIMENDPVKIDLPELADALADLDYVIEGTALEFGIDSNAVFRGVHEANMRKFGPGSSKREDGKVQKPPGWQAFDVEAELRRQGWRR